MISRGLAGFAGCRPFVRWVVLPALAIAGVGVVVLSVMSWREAASQPARYEAQVDLTLNPVIPAALYDERAAAVPPDDAMGRTLAFARGDEISTAIAGELDFEHTVEFEAAGEDVLRVRTQAGRPDLAVRAASSSAAIFGRIRAEVAVARLDGVIAAAQSDLSAAPPSGQDAIRDELARLQELRGAAGTTAYVSAPAEAPCCPIDRQALRGPKRGAWALIGLVLAAVAVLLGEWRHRTRVGPPWWRRLFSALARSATAIGRALGDAVVGAGRGLAGAARWAGRGVVAGTRALVGAGRGLADLARWAGRGVLAGTRALGGALGAVVVTATRAGRSLVRAWSQSRPLARWVLLPLLVVASVIVVPASVSSSRHLAARPDRFEARVDVVLDPVVPSARYDRRAAALAPDEAMDVALAFAERDDISDAIDAELDFEYAISFEAAGDEMLRIRAQADQPERAVRAASSAAATFGRIRAEDDLARVTEVVEDLQTLVAATTGDEQVAARRRLDEANEALEAEGRTAYVEAPPETPCCLVDDRPWWPLARGALVLVGLAVAITAVLLVEWRHRTREGPPWWRRVADRVGAWLAAAGRGLGAVGRVLLSWGSSIGAVVGRAGESVSRVGSGVLSWTGRVGDTVRGALAAHPVLRGLVLPVVVVAVLVAVIAGFDETTTPDRFETSVDVVLDPVMPSARYDDAAAELSADEALARAVRFARGDDIAAAIDEELDFEYSLDIERHGGDTLRLTAGASQAILARQAAQISAAVLGRSWGRSARAHVDEAITELEATVRRSTGAEQDDARARLVRARLAREAEGVAYVEVPPDLPCCPVTRHPARAAAVGGGLGAVIGLALAGVMLLERRRRPAGTAPVETARVRRAERSDGRPPMATWVGPAVVTALVVGRSAIYATLGPRFLLDDYLILYRRGEHGVLGAIQASRLLELPVKWVTQTVLFGVSGDRPLLLFVLMTALNLAAALALYQLMGRFFPAPAPLLVASLWVLTANHSTLTVWAAASQGVVAITLCCAGITLLSKGRWLGALALMSGSILSYELTIPICVVAALVVGTRLARPLDAPVARDVRPWHRAVMVGWLAAVVLWMSSHPTYPIERRSISLWDTWAGHFSSGLTATDSVPTALLRALEVGVGVALVLCVFAWLAGDRDRSTGPSLALAGVAVMALGLVLTIVLPGGTFGLFNRLYAASSIGASMILVGVGLYVWHRLRSVALAGAVGLFLLCGFGQWVALRAVHRAGQDVVALVDHLATSYNSPANTDFLVEPRPDHDGFYGVDQYFGLYPYKLRFPNGSGSMRLAEKQSELDAPRPGEVTVTWAEVHDR